jgi:hypothetical protein
MKYEGSIGLVSRKMKINRKFHVATEIGSTFFGFQQFTGQLIVQNDFLSSA